MRIGLFVPHYVDAFHPDVGIATLELDAARFRRPVREQDRGVAVDGQATQSIDNLKP
jgi:hypothetical protein